jgi:hypothetical protein
MKETVLTANPDPKKNLKVERRLKKDERLEVLSKKGCKSFENVMATLQTVVINYSRNQTGTE